MKVIPAFAGELSPRVTRNFSWILIGLSKELFVQIARICYPVCLIQKRQRTSLGAVKETTNNVCNHWNRAQRGGNVQGERWLPRKPS